MKKIVITILVLVIASYIAIFAFSYVLGGTNLGFGGYPKFSETKPSKPFSYGSVSKREYEKYKRDVEKYVDSAKEYIENGNNDIKRIQEAQEDAIAEANNVVEEFNRWIRTVNVSSNY